MESKLNWLRDYLANEELSEIEQLRAQLETARNALERIALGQTMSSSIAARALAQIGAGQEKG